MVGGIGDVETPSVFFFRFLRAGGTPSFVAEGMGSPTVGVKSVASLSAA